MKTAGADALLRYRVLRSLGPTRFGNAQLALLEGEERGRGFFALELLRDDWAKDPELRGSFLDEAAHTLSFEHPNVVRTQEVLATDLVCGRVTRWFAGQSLALVLERVGREQFPLHLHVRVLCEVLAAVQYLHEQEQATGGRLLYRDTAPAHVLVTYTGQIKIVGAGFERTIDEIERRSGVLFSDIDYASPELCLGYPAAPSADVYSVGVMLWEALARARRIFADSPEAKVRMRINGEEPDVDQFRRGVPDRLAQICRRALAVSPRDRYPSAQELQIDLESFIADTETDAQQNAGLGALAELMGQHFASERAEMLGYIEQQLAEPEMERQPAVAPPQSIAPTSARARSSRATSPGVGAPSLASSAAPRTAAGAASPAPRLELAPDDFDELDGPGAEGPTELLPTLEPARWDEHTHTVTSFEELGPVEPQLASLPAASLPAASLPAASLPPPSLTPASLASSPRSPAAEPPELADPDASEDARQIEAMLEGLEREELPSEALLPEQRAPEAPLPGEPSVQPAAHAHVAASPPPLTAPERGARPQFLELPVREPDTSGHRAYSSTLRPPPPPPRDWLRTAGPVALAAALVLLVGFVIREARSTTEQRQVASGELAAQPANAAEVSNTELRLQAAPPAPEVVEIVHPSALAEVGAAAPVEGSDMPAAGSAETVAPGPASAEAAQGAVDGDLVELVDHGPAATGTDGAPVDTGRAPPEGEGAPVAVEPAIVAAEGSADPEPGVAAEEAPGTPPGDSTPEERELEPPPLVVEELLNGEERRPPPRARRSRAKAADSRGARSGGPQPRAIDETDPYLE